MQFSASLPCTDIDRAASFYQRLLQPIGRAIQATAGNTTRFVPFYYNLGLLLAAHPGLPVRLHLQDIDVQEVARLLQQTLPQNTNPDLTPQPGTYLGIYETPGSQWVSFTDTEGNTFHFEEFFGSAPETLARVTADEVPLQLP